MNQIEHDRRETRDSIRDYAQSRIDFAAEQIIDGFDWKNVRDAMELAAEIKPEAFEALCEALAHLQHIPISQIKDRHVRNLSIALDRVALFYAGHLAAQEVV